MPRAPHNIDSLVATSGIPHKRICAACDISEGTLRNWRKGRNMVPSDKLVPLAEILGVSIYELMGWPDGIAA